MNIGEMRVLIIDDVKTVRAVLQKNLKSLGFSCMSEAGNIKQAIKIIQNSPIDLVFCDWNMPDGDGIDLLKYLRSSNEDKLKYMKFIMVTGSDQKVMAAMDEGAHNIIHKPFTPELIMKKLELMFN